MLYNMKITSVIALGFLNVLAFAAPITNGNFNFFHPVIKQALMTVFSFAKVQASETILTNVQSSILLNSRPLKRS